MSDTTIEEMADLLIETERHRRRLEKNANKRKPESRAVRNARRRERWRSDASYRAKEIAKNKGRYDRDMADGARHEHRKTKGRERQTKLRHRTRIGSEGQCKRAGSKFGIPWESLLAVLQQQQFRCAVTGLPLDFTFVDRHPLQPSPDHIVPRAHGGQDDASNIRWVIWAVNATRGHHQDVDGLLSDLIRPSDTLRAWCEHRLSP